MRIGFITGEYPPMEGGVGAFTQELAYSLSHSGHEVLVFTRQGAGLGGDSGITVFPEVGSTWGWSTLSSVQKRIRQCHPDIINLQFETAAYNLHPAIHFTIKTISPTPVVTTFHDLREPYLFPKAGRLRTALLKKLANESAGVINTDRADEAVIRKEWGIHNNKWIPIGSNITVYPKTDVEILDIRNTIGAEEGDLILCYFGFLNASKGALILIDALQRILASGRNARLLMIGGRAGASDPTNYRYGADVDRKINEYGIGNHIFWSGFCDDTIVSGYFFASDICVLPFTDGVSLRRGTLMAALAHGMPIVTTEPMYPIPELANTVALVPRDDPEKTAQVILSIAENDSLKASLRRNALRVTNLFTWDKISSETHSFYEECLKK